MTIEQELHAALRASLALLREVLDAQGVMPEGQREQVLGAQARLERTAEELG